MKKESAKLLSTIIVYAFACSTLIFIGFQIENVDETLYPAFIIALVLYYTIGNLFLLKEGAEPPESKIIEDGQIDLIWGLRHTYWILWWPHYAINKK